MNKNTATTAIVQVPAHPPPTLLGETYGFWCQTLVLLGAAFFAYLAIKSSRAIEKKKAAANVLLASRRDRELSEGLKVITKIHEGDTNVAKYAKKDHLDTPEAKSIKYALNHYEYVSVGINEKIFDESFLKSAVFTTVTKLYQRTKPFIEQSRETSGTKTIFQEFEGLASRWLADPLDQKSVTSVQENRKIRKWLAKKILGNP
jgi:hypothetical protein